MHSYQDTLTWLFNLSARGIRLELDRMRSALAARGNPQRAVPVVHIGGTNGKGSVSAMCERIFREAGYRTGHFTSPHLHRYSERFRINGDELAASEVSERLQSIRDDASLPTLTFFEISTLLAFEAFRDHQCDVVVMEVGLGGRLDATNLIEAPVVTTITNIALDHVNILGSTLSAIAQEKCGILKRDCPAVIGTEEPEAIATIRSQCAALGIDAWYAGTEFSAAPRSPSSDSVTLQIQDQRYQTLLALAGPYQAANAAVAVATLTRAAARGFPRVLQSNAIAEGLAKVRWPGRLETLRTPDGHPVLVDCAHNPDGCAVLSDYLKGIRGRYARHVLLFSALADKHFDEMLPLFDDAVDERVYVRLDLPRAPETAEVFRTLREGTVAASVTEALDLARHRAGTDGLVIVAGSIFLVGEVRAHLLGERVDPAIAL